MIRRMASPLVQPFAWLKNNAIEMSLKVTAQSSYSINGFQGEEVT